MCFLDFSRFFVVFSEILLGCCLKVLDLVCFFLGAFLGLFSGSIFILRFLGVFCGFGHLVLLAFLFPMFLSLHKVVLGSLSRVFAGLSIFLAFLCVFLGISMWFGEYQAFAKRESAKSKQVS